MDGRSTKRLRTRDHTAYIDLEARQSQEGLQRRRFSRKVDGRAGRNHRLGTSPQWMAVSRIDNLDINREAGVTEHDAGHSRGFVPLEVRARGKPKAPLATRTICDMRRDADRLIALCIVLWDDPDISRRTEAGVDRLPARVLHAESECRLLANDNGGRDGQRQGQRFPKLRKNQTGLLRPRGTRRITDRQRRQCKGSSRGVTA